MNPTPSRERICLLTGGGYPFRRDALSGWCRTLVEGLRRHRFDLLTVTERETPSAPAYPLPLNVGSARAVALSGFGKQRRRGQAADAAEHAAGLLCHGLFDEEGPDRFARGLRQVAGLAVTEPGALGAVPLADLLADAWRATRPDVGEAPLPKLSTRDARTAATLLRHALGALAVDLPEVDLVHCVGGTTPLLGALAGHWRGDVPLLLTEARAPVARHKPAEERLSLSVRTILRRFRTSVARTGYAEAGLIAPLSTYHHDWALRHGARPDRLVQVPAGVDPAEYPGAAEPSGGPAVVWAGSGGPDSGLTPLLAAFEQVAAAVPGTVLHLVGVTPAHVDHCAEQIERTGLGRAVRLHPLPADPRDRYTLGHVVAHVPGPADPPYRLIEAMMSGRAVVGVDVGPAGETLGDAGVLVQPGDPAELAIAVVGLLRAPGRRRVLGDAARRRALQHFTNDRVVRVYGALYSDLVAARPAVRSFEPALALPAPRGGLPATVRWLTGGGRPAEARQVVRLRAAVPLQLGTRPATVATAAGETPDRPVVLPASPWPGPAGEAGPAERPARPRPPIPDAPWLDGAREAPVSSGDGAGGAGGPSRPPVADAPWIDRAGRAEPDRAGDVGRERTAPDPTGEAVSVPERHFREEA